MLNFFKSRSKKSPSKGSNKGFSEVAIGGNSGRGPSNRASGGQPEAQEPEIKIPSDIPSKVTLEDFELLRVIGKVRSVSASA